MLQTYRWVMDILADHNNTGFLTMLPYSYLAIELTRSHQDGVHQIIAAPSFTEKKTFEDLITKVSRDWSSNVEGCGITAWVYVKALEMCGVGCFNKDYPHKVVENVLREVKMDAKTRRDVINICTDYILNREVEDSSSFINQNCPFFVSTFLKTIDVKNPEHNTLVEKVVNRVLQVNEEHPQASCDNSDILDDLWQKLSPSSPLHGNLIQFWLALSKTMGTFDQMSFNDKVVAALVVTETKHIQVFLQNYHYSSGMSLLEQVLDLFKPATASSVLKNNIPNYYVDLILLYMGAVPEKVGGMDLTYLKMLVNQQHGLREACNKVSKNAGWYTYQQLFEVAKLLQPESSDVDLKPETLELIAAVLKKVDDDDKVEPIKVPRFVRCILNLMLNLSVDSSGNVRPSFDKFVEVLNTNCQHTPGVLALVLSYLDTDSYKRSIAKHAPQLGGKLPKMCAGRFRRFLEACYKFSPTGLEDFRKEAGNQVMKSNPNFVNIYDEFQVQAAKGIAGSLRKAAATTSTSAVDDDTLRSDLAVSESSSSEGMLSDTDPENALLDGGDLSTMICMAPRETSADDQGKPTYRNRRQISSSDRVLLNAFREISQMSDRLNLPRMIVGRAHTLLKQFYEGKTLKRSNNAIVSACLYIACRQEMVAWTFKEISAVSKVSKKKIGRAFTLIMKTLETSVDLPELTAGDFISRYCSNLSLPASVQKGASHIARKATIEMDLVSGRSPISVAMAAIYMASQASEFKKTQKEIGNIAGVAEVNIKQSYKLMYPKAHELFPKDFKFHTSIEQPPAPEEIKKEPDKKSSKHSSDGSANNSRSATPTNSQDSDKKGKMRKQGDVTDGPSSSKQTRPGTPTVTNISKASQVSDQSAAGTPSDGITEDAIRRYLMRKPMTIKELLQRFRSKHPNMTKEHLFNTMVMLLKKIGPEIKMIGDKRYLTLKKTAERNSGSAA